MEKTRLLSLMIVAVLLIPVSVVAMESEKSMDRERKEERESLLIHTDPKKVKRRNGDGSGSSDESVRRVTDVDAHWAGDDWRTSTPSSIRNGRRTPAHYSAAPDQRFFYLAKEMGRMGELLQQIQRGIDRSVVQRSQVPVMQDLSEGSTNPSSPMGLPVPRSSETISDEIARINQKLDALGRQQHDIHEALEEHMSSEINRALEDIQDTVLKKVETILDILSGRGSAYTRSMIKRIVESIGRGEDLEINDEGEGDEEEEIVYSGHEEYLVEDGRERRRENVESAATATVLRRQRERGRGNGQLKTTMRYKPGHTITRRQSRTFLEQSSQATQTTPPDTDVMEASPVLTASSNDTFSSTGSSTSSSMNSNMSLSSSSSSSPSSSSPARRVLSSATPPPPSRLVSLTSGSGVSSSTSSSSSSTSASQSPERTQSVPVSSPQLLDRTQSAPVQSPPEANGVRARLYNTFSGLGSGIAGFARDLTSTDGFFPEENNKQQ